MKVHGIFQAAASSELLNLFRLLMLPLVQLPAHLGIAVALLRAVQAVCRGCKSPRSQGFQREADVCDNCNQLLVVLLLLRCGLRNLKRKQMFHNLLGTLLQFLPCGCRLQNLMANITDNLSDFDCGCDVSHD